ncbi:CAP-Gly domain [Nesidiocoris tenuis]|uniref:ubiquitinyl hydrolase 1 n=2 Tax=Nesidiocoris tenuis TaxID=355587 RepID=A0ABN7A9J1_9HEMI|nr:CAP-Gly domain [Nesidiocoris tenuis]
MSSKKQNFSLVKSPTSAKRENSSQTILLQVGTLVLKVKTLNDCANHQAVVKIVDVKKRYGVRDEDQWICPDKDLIPVDSVVWPYLEAVPSEVERVALLSQGDLVHQLADLGIGSYVFVINDVDYEPKYHKAIVKFKGKIAIKGPGFYFGVELLDNQAEGDTDGTYGDTSYFKCDENKGIFCTISRLKPFDRPTKSKSTVQQVTSYYFEKMKLSKSSSSDHVASTKSSSKWYCNVDSRTKNDSRSVCPLAVGDRVVWVTDDNVIDCTVKEFDPSNEKVYVALENPIDTSMPCKYVDMVELVKYSDFHDQGCILPKDNGDLITWGNDAKENVKASKFSNDLIVLDTPSQNSDSKEYDFISSGSEGSGYYDTPEPDDCLSVGSLVEVMYHGKPHYGVIRWIGTLDHDTKCRKMAGIEMEEENPKFNDGSIGHRKYFTCNPNRGHFVRLGYCRQDSRFMETIPHASLRSNDGFLASEFVGLDSPVVPGCVSPISGEEDITPICGKYKGIQGHHNSCYLDATLFSMFTFTSVFDSLLYRPPGAGDIIHYKEVQKVLREEIVNPLRKFYFVKSDRVMKLRRLMEKLSDVSGLTTEEKDPEEFLTSLVAQILKADPYLKLSSGQEAYHYQLFVEKNEKLVLPTVQQLFEQSFFASDIKLKEVPACLIIQMPRFGKSFKMYPRILPSQLLDVTDVIEDSPRQCSVCGNLATVECRECFDNGPSEIGLQNISFCRTCLKTAHNHENRRSHTQFRKLSVPQEFQALKEHCAVPRLYMQLFAVVCIETSHYVTFVKCGFGADAPWCFFDSMADRKGEQNGYNIPEVVPCPDLPRWLSDRGAADLQQVTDDRQLPEHAKRLLCDAYMCMYQSIEVMMYR